MPNSWNKSWPGSTVVTETVQRQASAQAAGLPRASFFRERWSHKGIYRVAGGPSGQQVTLRTKAQCLAQPDCLYHIEKFFSTGFLSVLIPKRPRHYLLGCSKACRLLGSVGFDLQKWNLSLNGIFCFPWLMPQQVWCKTGGDSITGIKLRRDTGGRFVSICNVGPLSHLGERPAWATTRRRRDKQRLYSCGICRALGSLLSVFTNITNSV